MDNEKLNSYVTSYQSTKKEDTFLVIYNEVMRRWRNANLYTLLAKRYKLCVTEVEGIALEKLFYTVNYYRPDGDYYNMLGTSIRRSCIDEFRKNEKRINDISIESFKDKNDMEIDLSEFLVCANAEDEAIQELQIKNDQRQLIVKLLEKANEKSRQALNAYSVSSSYLEASKLLGVDNQTVERRIKKISKYFDANQNGTIYDFFTVATIPA